MILEVNDDYLNFIIDILQKEFDVKYSKNEYSKEYVYVLNNQVVGFIIYEYIYDRIELDYIYVLPDKRKAGIASELMTQMIDFASQVDSCNITLEVNENNCAAIRLYENFDFKICAKRDRYYKNESAYLMIRE